jgi:hypothetical protein
VDAAGVGGDATVSDANGSVTLSHVEGMADVRNSFGDTTVTGREEGSPIVSGNGPRLGLRLGRSDVREDELRSRRRDPGRRRPDRRKLERRRARGGRQGKRHDSNFLRAGQLESVAGAVDVDNQNGAVEVRGLGRRPGGCSKIQLKASFAPIRVALDPQGSYTLAARTSFGRVSSEIPIATTGERGDSLSGTIGGDTARSSCRTATAMSRS